MQISDTNAQSLAQLHVLSDSLTSGNGEYSRSIFLVDGLPHPLSRYWTQAGSSLLAVDSSLGGFGEFGISVKPGSQPDTVETLTEQPFTVVRQFGRLD